VRTPSKPHGLAGSSLKAALDLDWDDPAARQQALEQVLSALEAVERWLAAQPEAGTVPAVRASLEAARQVQAQDVERAALDAVTWRRGVAPERRLSIADAALRHGRKSRRQRVDEDKRHGLRDLDPGLVRAVGVPPAGPAPGSLPSPFV
jgi:hypothetical protein